MLPSVLVNTYCQSQMIKERFYIDHSVQLTGQSVVGVTIGELLMVIDTHKNQYLGDCAPDLTVIPAGYGVSDFNAIMVMELQVSVSYCEWSFCHDCDVSQA